MNYEKHTNFLYTALYPPLLLNLHNYLVLLFSTNKKKFNVTFLFIVLLFLTSFTSISQTECGTPTNTANKDFGAIIENRGVFQPNPGPYCINVFFHIVRQSNGSGGFDPNEIDDIVDLLNDSFNPHNIYINIAGQGFIDNSNYYNLTTNGFNSLIQINNQANAINFYLVNSAPYRGRAEDIESKNLVVVNNNALTATSPHELGHCLNLFHTHKGCNSSCITNGPNNCPESDCLTQGDYVCDTPPDPCILNKVNLNCEYTGGGNFNPDTSNIMSYGRTSTYDCRISLSNGQGQRMRDALQESTLLQQVIGSGALCGLTSSEGDSIICADEGTVIEIINSEPPYNWSVTSNLTITQNNGNSITVIANDFHASETGTIWVSHHGVGQNPLKIDVWLGRPQGPESIYGPDEVNSGEIVSYQGGIAEGATSYLWWLPYPFDIVNPIDYFNDNWQMYPNNTRFNSHVFTGYGENNGFVQIMGVNKCGVGPAVYLEVVHDNSSGGGQLPIVSPYPNAADDEVNLDFSEYPEGTYYIYIYDIYGVLKYYGETSNTVKTINTVNLPNGLYFLNYYNGIEIIQMQLLIEH